MQNGAQCARILYVADADIAQPVERILGKDEVPGPNPGISSMKKLGIVRNSELFLFLSIQHPSKRFEQRFEIALKTDRAPPAVSRKRCERVGFDFLATPMEPHKNARLQGLPDLGHPVLPVVAMLENCRGFVARGTLRKVKYRI